MNKLLFVLKNREQSTGSGLSSGLINSVKLIQTLLDDNKIESKIVEVQDNNYIDKEISQYKPTHVIIEAIWVVPSKLVELKKLYPNVKWIVRIHSETPFLANEGIAMDWLYQYLKLDITIATNSERMLNDLQLIYSDNKQFLNHLILLPNYYKIDTNIIINKTNNGNMLNIGCFGAIRPLKNQLIQTMAAIAYVKKYKKGLNFHINASRLENDGSNNVLKNIKALFKNNDNIDINLIQHDWYEHNDFVNVIKDTIDLGMQVSLSETFNIVTADFVNQHIPVVVSNEIKWVNSSFRCTPTNINEIITKMHIALNDKKGYKKNIIELNKYNENSKSYWLKQFKIKNCFLKNLI